MLLFRLVRVLSGLSHPLEDDQQGSVFLLVDDEFFRRATLINHVKGFLDFVTPLLVQENVFFPERIVDGHDDVVVLVDAIRQSFDRDALFKQLLLNKQNPPRKETFVDNGIGFVYYITI